MSKEVILTALRQVLLSVGSVVATKFAIDGDTLTAIVSGLVALVAVVWGLLSKSKDTATVKAAQTVLETASTEVTRNEIAVAAAQVQNK